MKNMPPFPLHLMCHTVLLYGIFHLIADCYLRSTYFEKHGYDLWLAPLAGQQSPDLAIKSPLCCAAWHVKAVKEGKDGKEPDYAMTISHVPLLVKVGTDMVDIAMPYLELSSSAMSACAVSLRKCLKEGKDGLALTLVRMLNADERNAVGEKNLLLAKKKEDKKNREKSLLAMEDADLNTDQQFLVSSSLFSHIMK